MAVLENVPDLRDRVHELVDTLTDEELVRAQRYIEFVRSGYTDMLT
jgi:hypothetical protein